MSNTRPMRSKRFDVASTDGTRIAYWKSGRSFGPAIVFLHGFGLNHSVWEDVVSDRELSKSFQLIAVDLRGHGQSGNPSGKDGFQSAQSWADDLCSVFLDSALVRPVVVAWSYGGRMLNDYIRCHGADGLGGINYVAAATIADPSTLGARHACLADLCSDDPDVASAGKSVFLRDVVRLPVESSMYAELSRELDTRDSQQRKWLRERPLDYDDLLRDIDVPVLITHGEEDSLLSTRHAHALCSYLRQARLSIIEKAGHAPFISDPRTYTRELAGFAAACFSR